MHCRRTRHCEALADPAAGSAHPIRAAQSASGYRHLDHVQPFHHRSMRPNAHSLHADLGAADDSRWHLARNLPCSSSPGPACPRVRRLMKTPLDQRGLVAHSYGGYGRALLSWQRIHRERHSRIAGLGAGHRAARHSREIWQDGVDGLVLESTEPQRRRHRRLTPHHTWRWRPSLACLQRLRCSLVVLVQIATKGAPLSVLARQG